MVDVVATTFYDADDGAEPLRQLAPRPSRTAKALAAATPGFRSGVPPSTASLKIARA
jgi:hypothetical protein